VKDGKKDILNAIIIIISDRCPTGEMFGDAELAL
jgi:hypothetical protein